MNEYIIYHLDVAGDRFKTAVNDLWWRGEIINVKSKTQSLINCYEVRWDCNKCEYLSPWDMEPLTSKRMYQRCIRYYLSLKHLYITSKMPLIIF